MVVVGTLVVVVGGGRTLVVVGGLAAVVVAAGITGVVEVEAGFEPHACPKRTTNNNTNKTLILFN